MGKVVHEDDEVPGLDDTLDESDEVPGTEDAEELMLAELDDGPEEVGLDTELASDAAEPLLDTFEDDGSAWASDDAPLEVEHDLDVDGEEQGWLEDSEGTDQDWADDVGLDEDTESYDDGGLEGVEDPLLDDLDEVESNEALSEQEDDLEEDEAFEDALNEEFLREISP